MYTLWTIEKEPRKATRALFIVSAPANFIITLHEHEYAFILKHRHRSVTCKTTITSTSGSSRNKNNNNITIIIQRMNRADEENISVLFSFAHICCFEFSSLAAAYYSIFRITDWHSLNGRNRSKQLLNLLFCFFLSLSLSHCLATSLPLETHQLPSQWHIVTIYVLCML